MKKTIDNISKAARRDHRPDVRFDNDKCVSVYACICVRAAAYAYAWTYAIICQQIPR